MAARRHLAAIVFTDLAGFTTLAQSDERAALELIETQDRLVAPLLASRRGRRVKAIGDGMLLEFPNALDAVEFAVEFQRAAAAPATDGRAPRLRIRIGIHLGDVERRGSDILGDAVNVASRLEPLAEPGGICVSAPVFEQVRHKVSYSFEKLGARTLKGVRDPMEVYRVVLAHPVVAVVAAAGPPRLAVLPLANISPDPHDEYFADGLTEELISVLSQIRGLRVIARTSVSQYKGTTKPVGQIGQELGVSSVLEGSVRKAGDQLRITMQLIDVPTQEHRWAQTYDRKLENVFAIQAEVAERTAGALQVELLKPEREALKERPTSSLAAYEAYLRGLEAYHRTGIDRESFAAATRHFEAAVRADPEFAAAHAYLANILIGLLGQSAPAREVVPSAREHVERALELSPNSSDAHAAAGNLAVQADLDWPRAEAEFERAIALSPSNANARFWYSFLLGALQRGREAKAQLEAAIELDPLWVSPRNNLVGVLGFLGEHAAALELAERTRETFGSSPQLEAAIAFEYVAQGRIDEARRAIDELGRGPELFRRAVRALLLAWMGRPAQARKFLREREKQTSREYFAPGMEASLYAIVGEKERALELLERDLREGDRTFWNSYQSPAFDELRDDPRFLALLREARLPLTPPPNPLRGKPRRRRVRG